MDDRIKCWGEGALEKLPPVNLVTIKHEDGSHHAAIIESINEDGTVTIIEGNEAFHG